MKNISNITSNVEFSKFSLLSIAEIVNNFLYSLIATIGPEYEKYKTLFVAFGWCVIVGLAFFIIFFIISRIANLFEETSRFVEKIEDCSELDYSIPELQAVENYDSEPIEESNVEPMDDVDKTISEIDKKQNNENIILSLSSYNNRKTQIEQKIIKIREFSKKKIISYIKEEIDLFRYKITNTLKNKIHKERNMSDTDIENNIEFIVFKLLSNAARSKSIDCFIQSYEKGDFDILDESDIDAKILRRTRIYKQIFISTFQPLPINISLYSVNDIIDTMDELIDDLSSSMMTLVELIADEELDVKKQVLSLEEEMNRDFSHIIQLLDDIQTSYKD